MNFVSKHFWKRSYITSKALQIIKQVELIEKKEFAAAAFYPKDKVFVVYIASISRKLDINQSCKAYITSLKADKASISISSKYSDFVNVFFKNLAAELSEHTKI